MIDIDKTATTLASSLHTSQKICETEPISHNSHICFYTQQISTLPLHATPAHEGRIISLLLQDTANRDLAASLYLYLA